MQTRNLYLGIVVAAFTLFSCRKFTSIENNTGLQGSFTAEINGAQWTAVQSSISASVGSSGIALIGTSSDNKQLSIYLSDTVVGVYSLSQNSSSLAAYSDSSNSFLFSTNQNPDSILSGGTVTVTQVDIVNKTLTGTFSLNMYRGTDHAQRSITNGVFYKIPYSDTLSAPSNGDTLTAAIDGASFSASSVIGSSLTNQITVEGTSLGGSRTIELILPANTSPGTYTLSATNFSYAGLYQPSPNVELLGSSGSITVLSNNTTTYRIKGSFQYQATDPLGLGNAPHTITNGYFSVYYGP